VRRKLIGLAGATLFLAGACGGDDEPSGYTDEMRRDFISQCTASAGDGALDTCGCTYDALTENLSFEEFREFDEAAREDPSAELPAEVTDAMTECAENPTGAPTTSAPLTRRWAGEPSPAQPAFDVQVRFSALMGCSRAVRRGRQGTSRAACRRWSRADRRDPPGVAEVVVAAVERDWARGTRS
jgi:hypothetical protein